MVTTGRAAFLLALCYLRSKAEEAVREYKKPWATHSGCAELARRFDFSANSSAFDVSFRKFHVCVNRRKELPDWRSLSRPTLLAGEDHPVIITPSPRSPPGYWVLPAWDYVVSNYIRREGTFEPQELQIYKSLVQEDDVVLDIGAHVGGYTIPLAGHVGRRGSVHAFEPFRLIYQLLIANAAVNGISNIYGHNLALGQHEEFREVKGPALTQASNIGATRVFDQAAPHFVREHVLQYGDEETVRIAPLDAMSFKRVDFMKVDVEGALEMVLAGAQQTIHTHRPILAVEHEGGSPPSELLAWGYRCFLVLPLHDLWACVPHEKVSRHEWLAQLQEAQGVQPADPAAREQPVLERRRGEPPPTLFSGMSVD